MVRGHCRRRGPDDADLPEVLPRGDRDATAGVRPAVGPKRSAAGVGCDARRSRLDADAVTSAVLARRSTAVVAAVASWPILFLLRTGVLNQDGNMLTPKLESDVPLIGAHLSHDELLELFVHSKVWEYTHRWWGWSVVF